MFPDCHKEGESRFVTLACLGTAAPILLVDRSCVFSQVFLQHLSPLLSLTTFAALWLTILDFMDKYMHAGSSDLLVRCWMQSFGQPFIAL